MSKSLGYYNFTGSQAVLADSSLPLTTTVRQFGRNIRLGNNSAVISDGCNCCGTCDRAAGYYNASVNTTLTASAAGTITVRLFQDGQPVTGAIQTATVAAGDIYPFSFPAPVRVLCGQEQSVLTIIVSGQAVTATNVSLDVIKQ